MKSRLNDVLLRISDMGMPEMSDACFLTICSILLISENNRGIRRLDFANAGFIDFGLMTNEYRTAHDLPLSEYSVSEVRVQGIIGFLCHPLWEDAGMTLDLDTAARRLANCKVKTEGSAVR